MSDNDPNKKLNDKRLEIEMGTLQVNLQRFELRLMEMEAEKEKLQENATSSIKRIAEIKILLGA